MNLIERNTILNFLLKIEDYLSLLSEKYEISAEHVSGHSLKKDRLDNIKYDEYKLLYVIIKDIEEIEKINNDNNNNNDQYIYYIGKLSDILETLNLIQILQIKSTEYSSDEKILFYYESIAKLRKLRQLIKSTANDINNNSYKKNMYVYDNRVSLIGKSINEYYDNIKNHKEYKLINIYRFMGFPIALFANAITIIMIIFIIFKSIDISNCLKQINVNNFETFEEYNDYLLYELKRLILLLLDDVVIFVSIILFILIISAITSLIKKNYYKQISKAANEGNSSAKFVLAWKYKAIFYFTNVDREKFINLIIESAEDYYPPACYILAKEYEKNSGVLKRDIEQALKYYKYLGDYKDSKIRYYKLKNKMEISNEK